MSCARQLERLRQSRRRMHEALVTLDAALAVRERHQRMALFLGLNAMFGKLGPRSVSVVPEGSAR